VPGVVKGCSWVAYARIIRAQVLVLRIVTQPLLVSGTVAVWLLNGPSVIATVVPGGATTDWQVQ